MKRSKYTDEQILATAGGAAAGGEDADRCDEPLVAPVRAVTGAHDGELPLLLLLGLCRTQVYR